jgi:hypothetical protein
MELGKNYYGEPLRNYGREPDMSHGKGLVRYCGKGPAQNYCRALGKNRDKQQEMDREGDKNIPLNSAVAVRSSWVDSEGGIKEAVDKEVDRKIPLSFAVAAQSCQEGWEGDITEGAERRS